VGISPSSVFKRRAEVSVRELSDGGVVVNMRSGDCYELNRVGFRVWNALDGHQDVAQVSAALAGLYGVDPNQVRADVEALIQSLLRAGLLDDCTR
jgi:hypothetical protein